MPRLLRSIYRIVLAVWASFLMVPMAVADNDLPLRRVMLSTGGVGYFEHEAIVEGSGELFLVARLDQVDDILKSIVVYDDQGQVGFIDLPGREPLDQLFRDIPFASADMASPVRLMNALQGARVESLGQKKLMGRIIRVLPEVVQLENGGGALTRHRVSLMTDDGIQQFILEEAETVRFTDPKLQAQVDEALKAIAEHKTSQNRRLRIGLKGNGRRTVRVGYVVEIPLWKSSYRLTLPGDSESKKGHLQGWAVVENNSGHAWENVELTLVSGNPVTFRQALYTSYYVNRPEVPVEVLGRILPKTDQGSLENKDEQRSRDLRRRMDQIRSKSSGPAGSSMMKKPGEAEVMMAPESTFAGAPAFPPRSALLANVAESTEAAAQVLFRLPKPVSVGKGYSVNVPIVDRDVPIQRISIYQPATHARHPLASIELKNDGPSGLPPGILTIYERQKTNGQFFVGDAQLTTLPAGEERLVSFALDQKTLIDKTVDQKSLYISGSIRGGVYRRTLEHRLTTTYRLKSPLQENRMFIIEHPRRQGWELVAPSPEKAMLAMGNYRIKSEVAKAETKTLNVVMTKPVEETVGLSTLSLDRIGAFIRADRLSPELKNAFSKISQLSGNIEKIKSSISEQQKQRQDIAGEQKRIRDNLARVPQNSDLYVRYMKKLNSQEDIMDSLSESLKQVRAQLVKAKEALADFIASLDI